MHLVDIELSHQQLLTEKFRQLSLEISEYSFANIYLFRKVHHYKLLYEKELFINGISREGSSFLMPTIPFTNYVDCAEVREWLSEVDFLFPIPDQWLKFFDPCAFSFSCSENDSDYLFLWKNSKPIQAEI